MNNYIVIPARLNSSRLPNKMLLDKTGKPLIQHTWENVIENKNKLNKLLPCNCRINDVYIATDSPKIEQVCKKFGASTISTGQASCGVERTYLASQQIGKGFYINVQGDAPNVNLLPLSKILKDGIPSIAAMHYVVPNTELDMPNYNRTKVVLNQFDFAIYYSRYPIPWKSKTLNINVGVYAMSSHMLDLIYGSESIMNSFHNTTEKLEQLWWLENRFLIQSIQTTKSLNIDCQKDYDRFVDGYCK